MSRFMLSAVLALASVGGFAVLDHAQPLFATSPPAPARPADTSSCCYSSLEDAVYEGELELQGGNYIAYRIDQLDDDHWELFLWAAE